MVVEEDQVRVHLRNLNPYKFMGPGGSTSLMSLENYDPCHLGSQFSAHGGEGH